jgi:hypothetical protein
MALDGKSQVRDDDCVRCSTTVYALNEPRDVIISFRITRTLADGIEGYRMQARKRQTKTEAITHLLEAGLFVMEKAKSLQDPAVVKYFQENLYNVQLVDDIMEWPQDRVEAIVGVLVNERERRLRLRIGKH